jgi:NDP-sugar pyrophosphorylase family protein
MLRPDDLFRLDGWEHAELFQGLEWAWEALRRIGPYVEARLRPGIEGRVMEGAWVERERVSIGPGTVVEPGACIFGPAIIGRDSQVRQGAYIRGNALVGEGCVVGHVTEMKNSVMLDGAKAGHFAYVGDSLLGRDVNLGAGTKLANLKINETPVTVRFQGRTHETGLRKFGALIGDACELGCNSVASPGTIIGPGTLVYPNASVSGVIPPRSIVKLKQALEIHPRREPA